MLTGIWVLSVTLAAPAQPAEKPTASAHHEAGGVTVELVEIRRDSPSAVTARWRYRNESDEPKRLTAERTGWIDPYRLSLESYLLDEGKRIKFEVARDSEGRPVASRNGQPNQYIVIRPKQTIEVWAKYMVPESVRSVTVSIEGVPPFARIPIVQ